MPPYGYGSVDRGGAAARRDGTAFSSSPGGRSESETRPNAYWMAVGAVCIGAFMGQLDASIVIVALPSLQRASGASVASVTWVGLSYLLVLIATVAAVGRLAYLVGRKLLDVYGFLIFIAGSALCEATRSLGALDGSRAVEALARRCSRPAAWR